MISSSFQLVSEQHLVHPRQQCRSPAANYYFCSDGSTAIAAATDCSKRRVQVKLDLQLLISSLALSEPEQLGLCERPDFKLPSPAVHSSAPALYGRCSGTFHLHSPSPLNMAAHHYASFRLPLLCQYVCISIYALEPSTQQTCRMEKQDTFLRCGNLCARYLHQCSCCQINTGPVCFEIKLHNRQSQLVCPCEQAEPCSVAVVDVHVAHRSVMHRDACRHAL